MNRIPPKDLKKPAAKRDFYEEGLLFEEYIKNLFNQDSFKLKKWRKSSKIPSDTFLLDISYPDLELIFIGKKQHLFAVECKWRTKFRRGKIEWATKKQIDKYVDFQRKRAMTVFIAIGVGGIASNPERLFVTPLDNISMYTEVSEQQLIKYKRKPSRKFFYDTVQLRLW